MCDETVLACPLCFDTRTFHWTWCKQYLKALEAACSVGSEPPKPETCTSIRKEPQIWREMSPSECPNGECRGKAAAVAQSSRNELEKTNATETVQGPTEESLNKSHAAEQKIRDEFAQENFQKRTVLPVPKPKGPDDPEIVVDLPAGCYFGARFHN